MDLIRHLKLFEAVAEAGHFGRAAESMGMAQPPMSQAIRRLETSLGCTLFERTSAGAVLTPAGQRVREHAQRVHGALEDLREAAAGAPSTLRALVDDALPLPWWGRLIAATQPLGLTLELESVPTEEALQRARAADLPAVVLAPFRTEGLRCSAVAFAPLWEIPGPEGTSPLHGAVLAHAGAGSAFLSRLERERRTRGDVGPLRTAPWATALSHLAAGRAHTLWTTQEAQARTLASPRTPRQLEITEVAAGFQVVLRRAARRRESVQAYEALATALLEASDA